MTTADKGARLGNVFVDTLIYLILVSITGFILDLAGFLDSDTYGYVVDIFPFVLYFAYYFLFELLLGKTPGKYLTKTAVVHRNGKKPTPGNIILRSILRLIPYDTFSFVFGPSGLHDSLSKTIVVKEPALTGTAR